MLFQNELTLRLIAASFLQIWPIFYMSYFAYKLLKRAKNRSTYTLSAYFISAALTYFLATFSIFLVNTPFAYSFYVVSIYLFVFSFSFLINFSWLLIKLDEKTCYTKNVLRVILYAVSSLYVFVIAIPFKGITLNASTGWIPHYSLLFLVFSWAYFLIFLIIPQLYLSFKIWKVYDGIVLKRRLTMFIISVFLMMVLAISLFVYYTIPDNIIFRIFHISIGIVFGISAAYLIYKGFGKELE